MLSIEERSKIALLGGRIDWRTTPIANRGSLIDDARRLLQPDWWKAAEPRDRENREIIRLLERKGLGTLVDDIDETGAVSEEFKRTRDRQKKENETPKVAGED